MIAARVKNAMVTINACPHCRLAVQKDEVRVSEGIRKEQLALQHSKQRHNDANSYSGAMVSARVTLLLSILMILINRELTPVTFTAGGLFEALLGKFGACMQSVLQIHLRVGAARERRGVEEAEFDQKGERMNGHSSFIHSTRER